MLTRPPHILVTTPESLYILLTADKEPRNPAKRSRRSSSTKFTPSPTTSAARIWRFRSSAWKRSRRPAAHAHRPFRHAEAHRTGRAIPGRASGAAASRPSCRSATAANWISPIEVPGERAGPGGLERNVGRNLRPHRGARARSIAPRWSSSIRAAWPSASRIHLGERLGKEAVAAHHGSLVAQVAAGRRKQAEGRRDARAGRHRLARTGNRHRQRRPGLPDRLHALDLRGHAAHRPRRPLARRHPQGPHLRHHARRTARMRGAGARRAPAATSTAWRFPKPRSTFWRSRSWPCAPPKIGAKTISSQLVRRAYPYRDLSARRISTPSSRCSPKASPRAAAGTARTSIATA